VARPMTMAAAVQGSSARAAAMAIRPVAFIIIFLRLD
jgi:hypothetical protein